MNKFTVPVQRFIDAAKRNRLSYDVTRSLLQPSISRIVGEPASCLHTSRQCLRKEKKILSSEPTTFTSSAANSLTMPSIPPRNPYQPLIVSLSLFVFLIYFSFLREENDLDEELNMGLFDRVPQLEESHIMQAIPRMKDAGVDTREAERRLHELREARLRKEKEDSL